MEILPKDAAPDHVRATIAQLEGGLDQFPLSKAVSRIEDWQRVLIASENDELRGIGEDLKRLHDHLLGPNLDGSAIGALLVRLGEQTTAVAPQAEEEDTGRALQRLGSLLVHAGRALASRAS
jgi:hypothetical protein